MVELVQRRVFARAAVDVAHRMPRVSLERFDVAAWLEEIAHHPIAVKSAG